LGSRHHAPACVFDRLLGQLKTSLIQRRASTYELKSEGASFAETIYDVDFYRELIYVVDNMDILRNLTLDVIWKQNKAAVLSGNRIFISRENL
jgi:hypothetical protein